MPRKSQPTPDTYEVLQAAYDHFNTSLFGGLLPDCLMTLSNELRNAYGYYRNHPFKGNTKRGSSADQISTDEIALNPFTFSNRTDRQIYSTLVHEMVHLWQHHFGKLETKSIHDKEWANKMEELGLMPTSTGKPGGKRTGRRVTHYIIEEGQFDLSEKKFKGKILWRGAPIEREKKGSRRTKYTCPLCQVNAYAKSDVMLLCGACSEESGDLVVME